MKRRITMIASALHTNATTKQLFWLARQLPREQFSVSVISLGAVGDWQSRFAAAGIDVVSLPRQRFGSFAQFSKLCAILRAAQPTIVHEWGAETGWLGAWAARRAGVKLVVASAVERPPERNWFESIFEFSKHARPDCFVASNTFLLEQGQRVAAVARSVEVLPCAVPSVHDQSTNAATASPISRAEFLQSLALPADACVAAAIGPLVGQARLKDLAWATELLEANHKEFHFLILGDGPYFWRIDRYVRQIRHDDRIHILKTPPALENLLPHLACVWYGGEADGTRVELLEAMSHGVPIIASDVPGARELIVNRETGFLVPIGDRAEFARRTTQLVEDAATAQKIGAAGQAFVQQNFSVEQAVARWTSLYSALD